MISRVDGALGELVQFGRAVGAAQNLVQDLGSQSPPGSLQPNQNGQTSLDMLKKASQGRTGERRIAHGVGGRFEEAVDRASQDIDSMLDRSAKFRELERTVDRQGMQIREMDSSIQETKHSVVATNAKIEDMATKQDRTLDLLGEIQSPPTKCSYHGHDLLLSSLP